MLNPGLKKKIPAERVQVSVGAIRPPPGEEDMEETVF